MNSNPTTFLHLLHALIAGRLEVKVSAKGFNVTANNALAVLAAVAVVALVLV